MLSDGRNSEERYTYLISPFTSSILTVYRRCPSAVCDAVCFARSPFHYSYHYHRYNMVPSTLQNAFLVFAPPRFQKGLSHASRRLSTLAWKYSVAAECFLAGIVVLALVVVNGGTVFEAQRWQAPLLIVAVVCGLAVFNILVGRRLAGAGIGSVVLHFAIFTPVSLVQSSSGRKLEDVIWKYEFRKCIMPMDSRDVDCSIKRSLNRARPIHWAEGLKREPLLRNRS